MNLEFRSRAWRLVVTFLILNSVFCIPAIAHAQGFQIVPRCNPVPGTSNSCGVKHLLELLVNVYNFLLGFAALTAMLFIIWGGLRMLYFSYLEDSASELSAAKLTVRRAIGGFVIIALAYLIVSTALSMLGIAEGTVVSDLLKQFGLLK